MTFRVAGRRHPKPEVLPDMLDQVRSVLKAARHWNKIGLTARGVASQGYYVLDASPVQTLQDLVDFFFSLSNTGQMSHYLQVSLLLDLHRNFLGENPSRAARPIGYRYKIRPEYLYSVDGSENIGYPLRLSRRKELARYGLLFLENVFNLQQEPRISLVDARYGGSGQWILFLIMFFNILS